MNKFDRDLLGSRVANCLAMENNSDFPEYYIQRLALEAQRKARSRGMH